MGDLTDLPVLVELFAGSAAVTRYMVGAPPRLVSWLGAKGRAAPFLARALALRPRQPLGGVVLADAGPWGWVWPALLDVDARAEVVAVLRRWATSCPACAATGRQDGPACEVCVRAPAPGGAPDISDLWAWLASQPPRVDPAESVAGWLLLQSRSASGAPVWWDGSRFAQGSAEGAPAQPAGQRGLWRAQHGQGGPQAPRERDTYRKPDALVSHAPTLGMGDQSGKERKISQKGQTIADHEAVEGGWLMSDGRGVARTATEKGKGTPTRAHGLVHVATLADHIEGLGVARWPHPSEGLAEAVAAWLVLQAGSARGRPVDVVTRDGAARWSTAGFAHVTNAARQKGYTTRLHMPGLAGHVEALGAPAWPSVAVLHGDARDALSLALSLGRRARVVLDPPYHRDGDQPRDRTGYGVDLPLSETLQMAAQLADAGARVVICEGGPLAQDLGPGWYSYDTTHHYTGRVVGREWVTVNAPADFLNVKQQAMF